MTLPLRGVFVPRHPPAVSDEWSRQMKTWTQSRGPGKWISDALCGGLDPADIDRMFHGRDSRKARAICGDCPVAQQCRPIAETNPRISGTWGGTTYQMGART